MWKLGNWRAGIEPAAPLSMLDCSCAGKAFRGVLVEWTKVNLQQIYFPGNPTSEGGKLRQCKLKESVALKTLSFSGHLNQ